MNKTMTAVRLLEEIFLDEFKSACKDRVNRPDTILDVHKYFKYQNKVYTFNTKSNINKIFNELMTSRISNKSTAENDDVTYPIMFLTEVSQKLFIRLGAEVDLDEPTVELDVLINNLVTELSSIMTMHSKPQEYIKGTHYQSVISKIDWIDILSANPWLIVGILIKYTSDELTENLYLTHSEFSEMIKGLG